MPSLLRLYLTVRKPRNFLFVLCIFIGTSLLLHFLNGYDGDWGATNLILSIEASTAGAVLMMVAEGSAETQGRMLTALLAIAEAQKASLEEHAAVLRALKDADERILKTLTGKEKSNDTA
jgi:hypothetical protein